MKKDIRLYNVLFPIWILMFWPTPPVVLITLLGNLAIDCLVLYCTLRALKHPNRGEVVKKLWWRFWMFGFLADIVGAWCMLLIGEFPWLFGLGGSGFARFWDDTVIHIMHNPFAHPLALLVALLCIAVSGGLISLLDKRAMKKCDLLDGRQKHIIALAMAIVTAPWLFLVTLYW